MLSLLVRLRSLERVFPVTFVRDWKGHSVQKSDRNNQVKFKVLLKALLEMPAKDKEKKDHPFSLSSQERAG
jgi:hypothetical protein